MSGHMGEGKWNSLTLPTQPLLRQQSLGPGEPFSAVTPPMGVAAVYGVAQSRTRLKRLSSSSKSRWGNLRACLLLEDE